MQLVQKSTESEFVFHSGMWICVIGVEKQFIVEIVFQSCFSEAV